MTEQATEKPSFWKRKYNALKYGDVYQNWNHLMRLVRVTDSDEADPTTRKKKAAINGLIALYKFFTLFRMSLSVFLITGFDHIMGQTPNQTGNLSKLIVSVTGVVLVQWFLYRLVCIRLIMKDDMIFMQTLKSMVSWHGSDEPQTSGDFRTQETDEFREQKIRLARLIYAVTVLSSFPMAVCPYFATTGYLWLNIQASETTFQICCWVFWWVQDLILSTVIAIDFLVYPSMWFVVALNYRMDIKSLTAKIQQLMQVKGKGKKPVLLFKEIRDGYLRLARQADRVNRMSSPILLVLVLCTTPLVCICVFVTVHSDNWMFRIMFSIFGCVCSLFACVLLANAADITATSEKMHDVLCAAAARHSSTSLLSVPQKRALLLMIEHAASESHSFAMTTMDGQQYTMEHFVAFLIETGLQYTLLLTFNLGIALK